MNDINNSRTSIATSTISEVKVARATATATATVI
jgi:hypothetical protein